MRLSTFMWIIFLLLVVAPGAIVRFIGRGSR